MKTRKSLIAAAIAALFPLGIAVAGDNDYGGHDKSASGASFKKLDANRDGRVSQAEAAVDSTIVFSRVDSNGDGYLDSTEWKSGMKSGGNQPPATQPSGTRSPDTEDPRR